MSNELLTEDATKKVNAFSATAEKLGYTVSPFLGARVGDSATVVFAHKGNCDITMTWHETLRGACEQICDYLGGGSNKCNLIGNGLSMFNGKTIRLLHSLLRQSYDGGVFVLAQVYPNAKIIEEDDSSLQEIADAIISA